MLTRDDIEKLKGVIQEIYLADQIPWVVGYSGGKDSTAALQLVWLAIEDLPKEKRHKAIHIITNDTLVESPVVAKWVERAHNTIKKTATENNLPFEPHILTPNIKDTWWVLLIGKGYPYPRTNFRWCTDRLKIKPSNVFVQEMLSAYGEVILVLGTRKAESINRNRTMTEREKYAVREYLTSKANMQNELSFTPLQNWVDDDVWQFLMQYKNPWGLSNEDLLTMYRGATADNECPMMMSTETQSCGKSRFGCWTCTLVEKDKSMAAMIQNDDEKAWMAPLLQFRDDFGDHETDRMRRDFRRMTGKLSLVNDRLVHGPYKKEVREGWLRKLLEIEKFIQAEGPPEFNNYKIITDAELYEIRRVWLEEKFEFDDTLPEIYKEVTGRELDIKDKPIIFGNKEYDLLKTICTERYPKEELLFTMIAALLERERREFNSKHRSGFFGKLEKIIGQCYYKDEEDAVGFIRQHGKQKKGEIIDELTQELREGLRRFDEYEFDMEDVD